MTLRTFRKDSHIWDIAIIAILLNAFLQISACVHAAQADAAFSLTDPAIWCSIDKASAAEDATTDQSQSHDCCKDGRHCMGQAVALEPEAVPVPLAARVDHIFLPAYRKAVATGLTTSPYTGRGPPKALHA